MTAARLVLRLPAGLVPRRTAPAHRAMTSVVAGLIVLAALAALFVVTGQSASARPAALRTIRFVAGPSVHDRAGHLWVSDRRFARGGGAYTRTSRRIAGTHQPALFRTERVGTFAYVVPVEPGTYRVTVNMAEQRYHRAHERVFGVSAGGATRLHRVDPVAAAGWMHAVAVHFDTRVTGRQLVLRFPAAVRRAAVSSVELRELHRPSNRMSDPRPASSSPAPAAPSGTVPTPTSAAPAFTSTTPASASTTPTSATPTSVPTYVTPEMFGAKGDGVTDDTAALQLAFDNAAGRVVRLPRGHVYVHTAVLHLRTAGLHVTGQGELLATNEQQSSVWIEADNVLVDGGLHIKTAGTTQRWGAWEQMGVRFDGHQGSTLRQVTVDGSAAAGIYVGASTRFTLDHVTVLNTRADGIHMTQGSSNGRVIAPLVRNSGDDGVAIVSYTRDGAPCHDITVTSPRVLGTTWGRGLSVVGGTNITETSIDVQQSSAAGVYIGAEGDPWYTAAPSNVLISGGRIIGANTNTSVDHGAVLVLSAEDDVVPSAVTVRGLTVTNTRASTSRDLGVITYGAAPTGILFSGITITGGPGSAYQGNTPQSSYQLRGIVQNGVALPDQG